MKKSRILVVDDDPNISELIRLLLQRTMRFEVRVENHSTCALPAAREFCPDIVLLDVDMPEKDGDEVARELRADPPLRDVPILIITSLLSHDETHGLEMVSDGLKFLAKPVSSKVLIDAIDETLAQAASPKGKAAKIETRVPAGGVLAKGNYRMASKPLQSNGDAECKSKKM